MNKEHQKENRGREAQTDEAREKEMATQGAESGREQSDRGFGTGDRSDA